MPNPDTPVAESINTAHDTINPQRLFLASCLSLIATSVAFGVVTSNMDQFKEAFSLTNAQAGFIGGVTLWGFTISIFVLGPLVDAIGIRIQMRLAFICHLLGVLTMVFAPNFAILFVGGLLIALGNGTVEAACNPLVATLYPDRKTTKLNQFHVWFPGGIVIGGLLAFVLDNSIFKPTLTTPEPDFLGLAAWQFKLLLVLVPTFGYAFLMAGQKFPQTERVTSGLSFEQMAQAALAPLFILMMLAMCLTASLELGPGRWMNTAMNGVMDFAGDNAGILVLVYGTGLMALLRFFAGPVVHRLSPTGLLLASAILGGIGLFALSWTQAPIGVWIAATLFYVGVCYFWPTMLGFVAERCPRTGSLGLALMGGIGMASVGLVTTPLMGKIGDHYQQAQLTAIQTHHHLHTDTQAHLESDQANPAETTNTQTQANAQTQTLSAPNSQEAHPQTQLTQTQLAQADQYGMRMGFRWTAALSVPLMVLFGLLYAKDKAAGGYQTQSIQTP